MEKKTVYRDQVQYTWAIFLVAAARGCTRDVHVAIHIAAEINTSNETIIVMGMFLRLTVTAVTWVFRHLATECRKD